MPWTISAESAIRIATYRRPSCRTRDGENRKMKRVWVLAGAYSVRWQFPRLRAMSLYRRNPKPHHDLGARSRATSLPESLKQSGPTARPIPAWGAAPGTQAIIVQGLKARSIEPHQHRWHGPSALVPSARPPGVSPQAGMGPRLRRLA